MKDIDLGAILFLCGISMALGFDHIGISNVGMFMCGVGLGLMVRNSK